MPSFLDPLVSVCTRPGTGRPSQDRHVVLPNAVAVLDGADNPDDPPDADGGWYATQLGAALSARLPDHTADLADVAADAIATVAVDHSLTPGKGPSSTLSILRWDADAVEAFALADSPIGVTTVLGDVHIVRDDRRDEVLRDLVTAQYALLATGHGYGAEHDSLRGRMRGVLAERRNAAGGYWVAEADPRAAYHAVRARWPREQIRDALLTSDGAAAAVDLYGLYLDWPALLAAVRIAGVRGLLKTIGDAEAVDPQGEHWPRARPDDDATAVHIVFR